ncbi:4-hydroxy-3-methylbut-2-enyl diphosphate reductase [Candidatus Solirubrobacter pratensis]|uniref:4-hydroxy-3-methylbut-2-enyl diphosphate reductase n=1 Tax=Candidatus Solirubrobacter pratensis TaxID=1298857 RepID=UPI000569AF91|nr:4-hydroxy-3-methylbut-2-enyl diphosphate reductase [Candidatus Solirubrobacter pratensis]
MAEERRNARRVLLAMPLGFCAGVERAVETVERALGEYGAPVYVRGQIVHSEQVLEDLSGRGAVFVDSEEEVPDGAVCILSAHGVAPEVRRRVTARDLRVIDATCPLVAKVHVEVRRYARAGRTVVLIGRRGHEEVEGTVGEAPEYTHVVMSEEEIDALPIAPDAPVAYAMQTTLAVDDAARLVARLRERFSDLIGPGKDDICYASQNRQAAVKAIARECDLVLVAGARNSSNSNRLVDVARAQGTAAHLVPDAPELDSAWLERARVVGVGAGASAPQRLVDAILRRLAELGYEDVEERELMRETVTFRAPRWPS